MAKGLKVPCLLIIAEVNIRCQKKPRRLVYTVYPRIPPNTPLPIARSITSGRPSHYSNSDIMLKNVQYIHLTAAYLTTICQVIKKVFYLHMKCLVSTLKMFIFIINCHASRYVYITMSNGRVDWSVGKFPPNCLQKLAQFNMPAEFTLGY